MAVTNATRRQSEAIRASMREIRSELPYDVDDARERVKQLSDWKYHMSRRPVAVMATAAVVGYLFVPAKRSSSTVIHHQQTEASAPPAKRSVFGGIAGAVATLLIRQAATMTANQIASRFSAGQAVQPSLSRQEVHP